MSKENIKEFLKHAVAENAVAASAQGTAIIASKLDVKLQEEYKRIAKTVFAKKTTNEANH